MYTISYTMNFVIVIFATHLIALKLWKYDELQVVIATQNCN
jgi:hypothetical protein